MADILSREGRLEEAEEMIRSMPMKADIVIWGTLLAACRNSWECRCRRKGCRKFASLEPSHGASRILLSNIYADAGSWEEAYLVRRAMQLHRIQRLPGYNDKSGMNEG